MSWWRFWRWGRWRDATEDPVAGLGRARHRRADPDDGFHAFDALVDGLRGQVGAAQRRAEEAQAARLRRQLALFEDGTPEREDLFFHLAASAGGEDAVNLPLASLMYRRMPVVREVEVELDAAVERMPGAEPRYAFVFGPDAAKVGARMVRVSILMRGPQPGATEIRVEGRRFRTFPQEGSASA